VGSPGAGASVRSWLGCRHARRHHPPRCRARGTKDLTLRWCVRSAPSCHQLTSVA
jgi:hypothetical protein